MSIEPHDIRKKTVRGESRAESWSANALIHAGIIPSVFSIALSWTTCAFPFSRMFTNTRHQQSDILLGKERARELLSVPAGSPCPGKASLPSHLTDIPLFYLWFRDLITNPFSFIYSELHAYLLIFSGLRIRGLLKILQNSGQ